MYVLHFITIAYSFGIILEQEPMGLIDSCLELRILCIQPVYSM